MNFCNCCAMHYLAAVRHSEALAVSACPENAPFVVVQLEGGAILPMFT